MINNIYGDIKYIQFFGVGVIMMAIFTSTMFGGGIALIKDRENGIHEGYLVTPVQRTSIIAGIISSGTIRAFIAGFAIFLIDILITGIVIQSFADFLLVVLVILIACSGSPVSWSRLPHGFRPSRNTHPPSPSSTLSCL